VPQLLLMLVSAAEQKAFDPQTLRFAAVGGARVSEDLLQRAQRVGCRCSKATAVGMRLSGLPQSPRRMASGSVGRPLPHVEVRLAEDGEVLIKGSTLLGYLGTRRTPINGGPAAISASSTRGFLYLKGRKKHQFVTSFGRNVNPEWVEAELTQRRHIAQAFVYGEAMPHNHALLWPHRPTAATRNWPPPWPKPTRPCPTTPRCITGRACATLHRRQWLAHRQRPATPRRHCRAYHAN
jgi:long-subunit acyl-CoA synthetase (AMP-forming)